jgi:hypothetical protein
LLGRPSAQLAVRTRTEAAPHGIGAVSACATWATTALITVTVAALGVFSLLPGH